MASKNRIIVKLVAKREGQKGHLGHYYTTTRNKNSEPLKLMKYCSITRQRMLFEEVKKLK
ncbi:MAG: 50S ribosomal protein L33 [Candidatus Comchoanobacterales bacterium]